jgi:hypothetical protein
MSMTGHLAFAAPRAARLRAATAATHLRPTLYPTD